MTLEQLSSLPDSELAALGATKIHRWKLGGLLGKEEIDVWNTGEIQHGFPVQIRVEDYRPATDRNQSRDLLTAMVGRGAQIDVRFGKSGNNVDVWSADKKEPLAVPGNSPRSETVAALLAWQALEGGETNPEKP